MKGRIKSSGDDLDMPYGYITFGRGICFSIRGFNENKRISPVSTFAFYFFKDSTSGSCFEEGRKISVSLYREER
jgi:hypothetical protein